MGYAWFGAGLRAAKVGGGGSGDLGLDHEVAAENATVDGAVNGFDYR